MKDGLDDYCRDFDYFAKVHEGRFGETAIRTALGKTLKKIEGRPIRTKYGVLCLRQPGRRPARGTLTQWEKAQDTP